MFQMSSALTNYNFRWHMRSDGTLGPAVGFLPVLIVPGEVSAVVCRGALFRASLGRLDIVSNLQEQLYNGG